MGSSKYTFPNTGDNYEVMNCMYVHCKIVSSSSTLIQYSNPAELKISNWRSLCVCVCVCVCVCETAQVGQGVQRECEGWKRGAERRGKQQRGLQ